MFSRNKRLVKPPQQARLAFVVSEACLGINESLKRGGSRLTQRNESVLDQCCGHDKVVETLLSRLSCSTCVTLLSLHWSRNYCNHLSPGTWQILQV